MQSHFFYKQGEIICFCHHLFSSLKLFTCLEVISQPIRIWGGKLWKPLTWMYCPLSHLWALSNEMRAFVQILQNKQQEHRRVFLLHELLAVWLSDPKLQFQIANYCPQSIQNRMFYCSKQCKSNQKWNHLSDCNALFSSEKLCGTCQTWFKLLSSCSWNKLRSEARTISLEWVSVYSFTQILLKWIPDLCH